MKACCIQGYVHSGTPTGTVKEVYGLPCYISEPPSLAQADSSGSTPSPKALIVYIHDVFGWDMPNNRLLADRYAARTGARVYLPDFMNGNAIPSFLVDTMAVAMEPSATWTDLFWKKVPATFKAFYYLAGRIRGIDANRCRPRVMSFITALRQNEAEPHGLKMGVAGFCWAGRYVFDLCSGLSLESDPSRTLIDAAFTAHPARIEVPKDFENVTLPLCVAIGDVDYMVSADQCAEGKRILDLKGDKNRYEMTIIPGAKHGFALRWNPENDEEMKMAQATEDMAISFWAKWLGTDDRKT